MRKPDERVAFWGEDDSDDDDDEAVEEDDSSGMNEAACDKSGPGASADTTTGPNNCEITQR